MASTLPKDPGSSGRAITSDCHCLSVEWTAITLRPRARLSPISIAPHRAPSRRSSRAPARRGVESGHNVYCVLLRPLRPESAFWRRNRRERRNETPWAHRTSGSSHLHAGWHACFPPLLVLVMLRARALMEAGLSPAAVQCAKRRAHAILMSRLEMLRYRRLALVMALRALPLAAGPTTSSGGAPAGLMPTGSLSNRTDVPAGPAPAAPGFRLVGSDHGQPAPRGTPVLTAPDGDFEDVRRVGSSPAAVPAGACPEPVACARRLSGCHPGCRAWKKGSVLS